MRCGFIGVVEGRFVTLLVDFEGCRIGESGGVGRLYFMIGRGRRDGFGDATGCEVISAHNIGFCGVVANGVIGGVGAGKVDDSIGDVSGECEDGGVVVVAGGGGGFCSSIGFFGFLLCLSRTCSYNLMLLSNLAEQRL